MASIPPDRFDDARRAWIARHEYTFGFQKRRAELLNRQVRDRKRAIAGALPDPHDDKVMDPIAGRAPGTTTAVGGIDMLIVIVVAALAPIGWLAGRWLYDFIVRFIPDRLRAYPIPALLWSAVVAGLILVWFYQPTDSFAGLAIAPWLLAQIPAIFFIAGIYGILNGWLAVDGSNHWWPIAPPTPDDDPTLVVFGPDDVTAPSLFEPAPNNQ
ncbi:hypothetical protein [Mycobacteroides chelonae]|uniref:hypothetical protein n=1 Tax=Mycobacteroides chelonae TaxID=1774 RepID=UPI0009943EA1|nr:hypothetical protein [Mycobacteroides chelonae]